MKNVSLILAVLFVFISSSALAQRRNNPTPQMPRQGIPMPSRQARPSGYRGFPIPDASRVQSPSRMPMQTQGNPYHGYPPYGKYPHHGKKRPMIVVVDGGIAVSRVVPVVIPVAVQNQQNKTSNMESVLEKARVSASMMPNIYLQFDAFFKIAQATGDEKDLNRCMELAMNMSAKDRNEAFFTLAKLATFKGNFRIANMAKNGILNPIKKKGVEKFIAAADFTTEKLSTMDKKEKPRRFQRKEEGNEKKDDK